ncbi:TetR/AcrR family transcriptional regulator [Brevibacterium salitolerans]
MSETPPPTGDAPRGLTPTARRTRTAIMTAAIELLATRPEAPMTEIAEAAGVSRSTLHRYFADRSALKGALDELAAAQWQAAVHDARLDEGTGLEAFRRLCGEVLGRLDVLAWWMISPDLAEETSGDCDSPDPEDAAISSALLRGRADGSIDPAVDPEWLASFLWAVLYAVRFLPAGGRMSAFEAREQGMRTLLKAAAADPGAALLDTL